MISLHLRSTHGYIWHNDLSESLFVRGFCFDEEGYYYEGVELLEYFAGLNSGRGFEARIKAANGFFSVVWKHGEELYVAVDRLRAFPILWTNKEGTFHLSDHIDHLPKTDLDHAQADLFPYACYTLGHTSLWKEVCQLQAGEWLKFSEGKVETYSYFSYDHHAVNNPEAELREEFRTVATSVFNRLIHSARAKTFVIPLSGGYDSRFIVAMLRHLNYEKVICFTYGRPDSFEVQISQKVANQLGYTWHFVEYTEELMKLYQEERGRTYQQFASNGISVAHEQDYFAIHQLLQGGHIPQDAILVPGFGGDVLAGSWYPKEGPLKWDRTTLIGFLIQNRKFFSGARRPRLAKTQLSKMIDLELPDRPISSVGDAYAMLQYWGIRNRMSKFLVNAVRVYDFFDLAWRMPFWDHEWMSFWMGIGDQEKIDKSLYLSELSQWLFQPMKIDFHPPQPEPSKIRNLAKQLLPASFVDQLKAIWVDRSASDVNNQDALSKLICLDRGWNPKLLHTYDLNYLMGKSYLQSLQSQE